MLMVDVLGEIVAKTIGRKSVECLKGMMPASAMMSMPGTEHFY